MSTNRFKLLTWAAGKDDITTGKIYEHSASGIHFKDDRGILRSVSNGTWEPVEDPEEYIAETFAPLETNDAGETNLDVNATLEQRGNRYGSFEQHASISQGLLDLALQHADKTGVELDHVHKEALGMIFHKIGRIVNGDPNYYDSWKDIAGYATLAEQWVTKGETV